MTKVAELVKRYRETKETDEKALGNILKEFISDMVELMKSRNAKTAPAFIGILEEVNNRWERFASHFSEEIRKDGFIEYHRVKFPDVHSAWMRAREKRRTRMGSF